MKEGVYTSFRKALSVIFCNVGCVTLVQSSRSLNPLSCSCVCSSNVCIDWSHVSANDKGAQ